MCEGMVTRCPYVEALATLLNIANKLIRYVIAESRITNEIIL